MSLKNQVKEIANQVKNSNQPLTFNINEGDAKSLNSLIAELDKLGLEAEIVTIGGTSQGLYVAPKWDHLINQEEIAQIPEISPSIGGKRVLKTPSSSAITEVSWENGDLKVVYNSSNIPYTYPNVPEDMFLQLVEIEQQGGSVGKFIAKQIKPFYSAVKA